MKKLILKIARKSLLWLRDNKKVNVDLNKNDKNDLTEWAEWLTTKIGDNKDCKQK